MRTSTGSAALEQAWHAALGSRPVVSLARLDQGGDTFTGLDPAAAERPTLVGGSPYAPSCPAPTAEALDALAHRAKELGVPQIVVPRVRRTDDTAALRAAGFVPVAAGSECVVHLPGEVDDVLCGRIGAAALGVLRSRHRAAAHDLTWEPIALGDLDRSPWARDAFAALHRQAAARRGQDPLWTAAALDSLAGSALAGRTTLVVRRSRGGAGAGPADAVVQAGLVARSRNGRGLHCLTQAVGDTAADPRHALEPVFGYRLCLDARHSGLAWVQPVSGTADRGRRAGADLLVPLDHWLCAPSVPVPRKEKVAVAETEAAAEPQTSAFATEAVAGVPVPGPARLRHVPRFDTIDLSGNTNPFLGAAGQYPQLDTTELARAYLAALAALPGHDGAGALGPDHVLFSSGSVDGVLLLLTALAEPGDGVCVTPPTFPLYAHFARVLRLPVTEVPLQGDTLSALDTGRILAADPRVTFLCDPNNPVGTRLDPAHVRTLLTRTRGLVVIDEAYAEFSALPSYAGWVGRYDNLIVLRTLSKAWGLAGARCGIALAHPGIVAALRRVQVPFGFTDASQQAARERLTEAPRVRAVIRRILAERDRIAAALAVHPLVDRVFPSEANFLMVRLHQHARVMAQLQDAGIVVADLGSVIPATCRISVGDRRANDALLEALSAVR